MNIVMLMFFCGELDIETVTVLKRIPVATTTCRNAMLSSCNTSYNEIHKL